MNNLEDRLRAALHRHDPPEGLADRIIARVREEKSASTPPPARRPWRLWQSIGAIAAVLTLVSYSAITYQHTREERAARQAELALRIASEKLNLVRDRVFKTTIPEDFQ